MKHRVYKAADFKVQPWKNGQGTTTELFRLPVDADEYKLRISIAKVGASGPFSVFNGYDRTIIQLKGAPMTLRHENGRTQVLRLMEPYVFSGDLRTDGAITEPAEDYNVIVRRGAVNAQTSVTEMESGEYGKIAADAAHAAVYCLSGSFSLQGGANVESGELLVLEGEGGARLSAGAPATRLIVTSW